MSLKELQGPVPGVESVSDGEQKIECERAGVSGGGELARIRGSRIANDLQDDE
jgi:hypothetical protein